MVMRYAHLSPKRLREGIERLRATPGSHGSGVPAANTIASTIGADVAAATAR